MERRFNGYALAAVCRLALYIPFLSARYIIPLSSLQNSISDAVITIWFVSCIVIAGFISNIAMSHCFRSIRNSLIRFLILATGFMFAVALNGRIGTIEIINGLFGIDENSMAGNIAAVPSSFVLIAAFISSIISSAVLWIKNRKEPK